MAANRRAIGHGALAEKAILPALPPPHDFPYAIRLVCEVTGSNGSSSMASVCGATLALLDAGIHIESPVVGVSVGLAMKKQQQENEEKKSGPYALLLDITGTEDHYGEMVRGRNEVGVVEKLWSHDCCFVGISSLVHLRTLKLLEQQMA